mmetsp:Transcript_37197/g.68382  ORF Transcript_37197/g.68382 Transcript_37197/m.68382 type:complete len:113 (+) Transcript_37197:945-1283(+)
MIRFHMNDSTQYGYCSHGAAAETVDCISWKTIPRDTRTKGTILREYARHFDFTCYIGLSESVTALFYQNVCNHHQMTLRMMKVNGTKRRLLGCLHSGSSLYTAQYFHRLSNG